MITAAATIIVKLMADGPKDRVDIQNLLAVQGIPEEPYLREWACRTGVEVRLDRELAAAGLSPLAG